MNQTVESVKNLEILINLDPVTDTTRMKATRTKVVPPVQDKEETATLKAGTLDGLIPEKKVPENLYLKMATDNCQLLPQNCSRIVLDL